MRVWRIVLLCLVLCIPPEFSAVWYSRIQHDPLYVRTGVGTIMLGWAVAYLLAALAVHYYELRQERRE